jgi:hypothetical protein
MRIYEQNGWTIRRTQEVFDYLHEIVQSDKQVSRCLSRIQVCPQNWSAGGGVHFFATHKDDATPVFLKVGAYSNELKWADEVFKRAPHLCPRLYAKGTAIGDTKIGWMITEAIQYGPLGPLWKGAEFDLLIDAAVEFQRMSRDVDDPSIPEMTRDRLMAELEQGLKQNPPGPAKEIVERVGNDFDWVVNNSQCEICHGDLHLCNGLTRVPPPNGPAVLIDFQPIKQPWAMDAAYLQVLCSTDSNRPGFRRLVSKMARSRERLGMDTCADVERLSRITLAWSALSRWGCETDRRGISDYRKTIQEYLEQAAQPAGAGDA